jgi:hypothetical protein
MTETDDTQRRWQEIAEQLGLPPEPASQPEVATVPQPPLPETDWSRSDAELPAEPVATDMSEPDAPIESALTPTEDPVPSMLAQEEAVAERVEPSAEPTDAAEVHEEQARNELSPGGRRRRRRGSSKANGAEPTDDGGGAKEPAGDEPETEAKPDHGRRRGRGRSRSKKSDDQRALTHEPEPAAEDTSDNDDEDMSGWSIPSWQELIDSLYRPDR